MPAESTTMIQIPDDRIPRLLSMITTPTRCKSCGKEIWFVKSKNDKLMPITAEGISHYADCPQAKEFRGSKIEGI